MQRKNRTILNQKNQRRIMTEEESEVKITTQETQK